MLSSDLTVDGALIRSFVDRSEYFSNMSGKPVNLSFRRVGSLPANASQFPRIMSSVNPCPARVIIPSDDPLGVTLAENVPAGTVEFSRLSRNCQMHATAVIRSLNPDP